MIPWIDDEWNELNWDSQNLSTFAQVAILCSPQMCTIKMGVESSFYMTYTGTELDGRRSFRSRGIGSRYRWRVRQENRSSKVPQMWKKSDNIWYRKCCEICTVFVVLDITASNHCSIIAVMAWWQASLVPATATTDCAANIHYLNGGKSTARISRFEH